MKKMISILTTMIMVFAIILPVQNVQAAHSFTDVSTKHSNYNDIMYLVDKNVIPKTKTYGVKDIVTREEVAVMVAKAVGLNGTPRATKFSDVPKSNANSGYIQSAVEAGIINGYLDGTFQPNQKVTRGHMAAFIARAFDLPYGTKTFKDVQKGHTAYEAVSQLVAANITTGYEDGTFKPKNNLTKGHIAAFLARAVRYQEANSGLKNMKVHFIDVGQGDSILIQSPNGKSMLIDGGVKDQGNDLVKYIKAQGVKKLDYVVATHPDADHIGGLISVLNSISIGEFIDSGKAHTSNTYEQMINLILTKNIKFTEPSTGDLLNLDKDLKVQVLHVNPNASDNNDASIVLKVTYNKVSFLLTGDADQAIEKSMAAQYDVAATYLKAGHHGSNTSSGLSFLKAVKPQGTILSYGAKNSYGHPHSEVVSNLKTVGSKIYSTAEEGTVIVKTNGLTHSISAQPYTGGTAVTPTKPTTGNVNSGTYVIPGAPTSFSNCTAMRAYYPNGVKSTHPAYASKHDRDKDSWACEL